MFNKKNKQAEGRANDSGFADKDVFTLNRGIHRGSALHAVPEAPYRFELRDELGSLDDGAWYEKRLAELSECNLDETSGQVLDREIARAATTALKGLAEQREAHKAAILQSEKLELGEADGLIRIAVDKLDELEQARSDSAKLGKGAGRYAANGTVAKTPSGPVRDYGQAASLKESEAVGYAHAIRKIKLAVAAAIVFLSLLDVFLLYECVTFTMFGSPPLFVAFVCLACAAGPIFTAVGTANSIRKIQYEKAGVSNIALATLLGVATLGILAAEWNARSSYWNDDTGVALMLNVLAVAFALGAFGFEFFQKHKLMAFSAFQHEAEIERDLLESMQYLDEFTSLHVSDETRRANDDRSYHRVVTDALEAFLDAGNRARKALAKHVAKTPEELEWIMSTPIAVGEQVITGNCRQDLLDEARKALDAPTPQEISAPWSTAPNSHARSEAIAKALADVEKRFEEARYAGASDAGHHEQSNGSARQDEDDGDAPVVATAIG